MISTRTKDKLQRTIDKRDNFYVNRSKNFSIDKGEKYIRESELSGITLLALVVTIIVLLILAGVTISTINSNNGVLTQAKKATITSDLSKYKEEVELYKASKQMEGTEKKTADGKRFEATSLNANYQEKSLVYNTQDGNETGDITTIIPDLKKDYHDGKRDNGEISVTNGQMVFKSTNDELYKIAQDLGIEVDPYNVKIEKDSNGKDVEVLTSSDKNLLLMSEDGTVTLPYDIQVIDKGTFANVKGLKKIIIPYTVKEIRDNAFSNNNEIEEIVFQTKDGQGIKKIGNYAFNNCTKLSKINYNEEDETSYIPDTLEGLSYGLFYNCCLLKNIHLPSQITEIPGYCFNTAGIVNINLDNITKIWFEGLANNKFEKITIPQNMTLLAGFSIYHCVNLKEVKIESKNIIIESTTFSESPVVKMEITNGGNLSWSPDGETLICRNGEENKIVFVNSDYLKSTTSYTIPDGVKKFDFTLWRKQCRKINYSEIS